MTGIIGSLEGLEINKLELWMGGELRKSPQDIEEGQLFTFGSEGHQLEKNP